MLVVVTSTTCGLIPEASPRHLTGPKCMEPLAVDDDICILKHETAYTAAGESPVSVCAGDESVASHFALVTAYEDIKKRLRDTERENTLLRKRVKQLEDKLFRPDPPPSEGPQYVNKAFSAYRGIYIEKEDLQMELNKLVLMKSLNSPQDYWQVDRVSAEVKIHKLQEELERVTLENSRLMERSGEEPHGHNGPDMDLTCDTKYIASERCMQQMCQALRCEVTRLHSELKHQTGLIRRLRPLISETRQGTMLPDSLKEDCWYNGRWPSQSCSEEALGGSNACSVVLPPPPLNQASLDESS
ncbi:hypothetical protein INR49_012804, partial [Caranx melampygus]